MNLGRLIQELQKLRDVHGDVPVVAGEREGDILVPNLLIYVPATRATAVLSPDVGVLDPDGRYAAVLTEDQHGPSLDQGWTKVVVLSCWDGQLGPRSGSDADPAAR